MSEYIIRPFEGKEDIGCSSSDEVRQALLNLHEESGDIPILVNAYDGSDRIAIVGLGLPISTLQCLDKLAGVNNRALSDSNESGDVEFSYQGEATFIAPEFLVPTDKAIEAAVLWLDKNRLGAGLSWVSEGFPP